MKLCSFCGGFFRPFELFHVNDCEPLNFPALNLCIMSCVCEPAVTDIAVVSLCLYDGGHCCIQWHLGFKEYLSVAHISVDS